MISSENVEESEDVRLVAHIGSDANAPEPAVAIGHLQKRGIMGIFICVLSR